MFCIVMDLEIRGDVVAIISLLKSPEHGLGINMGKNLNYS